MGKNKMKYPSLTLLTIALILFTNSSISTNLDKSEKKTQFILERQIKSAKHSAEEYLEEISNLSNNAFELFYNNGEKGINFQTFEKIVQKTKSSNNKIPKEILQAKFNKFDTNGWGVMNFKDFSTFFKEFLITEAFNDIENRRFSNETAFNNTDYDLPKDFNITDPVTGKEILPKIPKEKSFLELGNLNVDDKKTKKVEKAEKKTEKKTDKKSEKVKVDDKKNMKKNEKKKLPEIKKNEKKSSEKKTEKKVEKKTAPAKPAVKVVSKRKDLPGKVLKKVIPSKSFNNNFKAKTIQELKSGATKWKTPKIQKEVGFNKNKHYYQ